jgi:hypothetical protein
MSTALVPTSKAAFTNLGLQRDTTAGGRFLINFNERAEEIPKQIWQGLAMDRVRARRALKHRALGINGASTGINGIVKQVDEHHAAIEDFVIDFANKYAEMLYSQAMYDAHTASNRAMILAEYMLNEIQNSVDEIFSDVLGKASNDRATGDGLAAAAKLDGVEYDTHTIDKPKPKRLTRKD